MMRLLGWLERWHAARVLAYAQRHGAVTAGRWVGPVCETCGKARG